MISPDKSKPGGVCGIGWHPLLMNMRDSDHSIYYIHMTIIYIYIYIIYYIYRCQHFRDRRVKFHQKTSRSVALTLEMGMGQHNW